MNREVQSAGVGVTMDQDHRMKEVPQRDERREDRKIAVGKELKMSWV